MTKLQLIETSPHAEMGFAMWWNRLLARTAHTFAAVTSGLTPHQQYDAGVSDSRPLPPVSARQQIDSYSGSIAAMLNRRI